VCKRYLSYFVVVCFFLIMYVHCGPEPIEDSGFIGDNYWVPPVPPRAHYTIDCRIDSHASLLEGTEVIRFTNNTSRFIHRIALDWGISSDQTLEITVNGKPVPIAAEPEQASLSSPILFDLPQALPPSKRIELNLKFTRSLPSLAIQDKIKLTGWHPRLWWGFWTHEDFAVKLQVPPEYALATSGRLDEESGYYKAEGVRSFGLFLGKDHQIIEANTGDVLVRCLVTPQREECARFLLTTAVDVIDFYQERFGFYPYRSLTIVPGSDQSGGGYPVATCIVAIHGQQRFSDERPDTHGWWRWITAHEIGHQYWLEYVLNKEPIDWGWLMIGMGIYTDREYSLFRGMNDRHRGLMGEYIKAVRKHLDTTIERPPEQLAEVEFDIEHSKGFSVISALARVLGQETFDRIYQRCLKEFSGRRLGTHEFQAVCEEESIQNLGWFFDQWVRSNRYLSYQITSEKCTKQDNRYVTEVQVECIGTLKMPVPVVASFQDDTQQLRFTDRLLEINWLRFESTSPLKEVKLDPHGELPLVVPPPEMTENELRKRLDQMEWTGVGKQALDLFHKAQEINSADFHVWKKLGLTLYDGEYYPEALEAFQRAAELTKGGAWVIVWQGHILDILGRREEAVQRYREALEIGEGINSTHDQYHMKISRQWVEDRLKTPYRRK